jgi:4,5:9,10-diseco-3-hydroxy-5,9,17-trioxoandrosta-1(10),2-diene-4-oate hydrolase
MAPGGLEVRDRFMEMKGIRAMIKAVTAPGGITRESLRKVLSLQLFDPSALTDALVEERFQIASAQPVRVLTSLKVPYLAPRLAEIACPVLAFWGNEDQFCPVSGATAVAEQCPDSRVMRVSRCGHWVMVEHARMFNEACVSFLRS